MFWRTLIRTNSDPVLYDSQVEAYVNRQVALRRTARKSCVSLKLYDRTTFHSGDAHVWYLLLCANQRECTE